MYQLSTAARNAAADAIETTVGASPTMEIRSGSVPASCAAADSGTVLATLALPADWMAASASGAKALLGTWQDAAADATGTAGHWRIKAGATCHIQGTVTATGGGGDLVLDDITLEAGQPVSVTAFSLSIGGA